MKANAPEKIYRTTTYLDNNKGKTLWKTKPVAGAENVEYTLTDAFIEKALRWMISKNGVNDVLSIELVDDFKEYMKGE